MNIDSKALSSAIEDVKTGDLVGKKITLYSEAGVRILRYLDLTTPMFSRSKAASELITEAIKEKYPELWMKIEEAIPPRRDEDEETRFWESIGAFTDSKALKQAEDELALPNGKVVTIYNPRISAVLRYFAMTVPRYSLSKEGCKLLQHSMEVLLPKMWEESFEISDRKAQGIPLKKR